MSTAVVPIPANTPTGTGVRMYRQSGRPLPMYLDASKTKGPDYYFEVGTFSQLYCDVGFYRLRLIDPHDAKVYTETDVQVGVGQTPATPGGDYITPEDLTAALSVLTGELAGRFADVADGEVISGAWTFQTLPVDSDGNVIGSGGGGGGGGGASQADIDAAVATVEAWVSGHYLALTGDQSVVGTVDFSEPPTIAGVPITGTTDGTARASIAALTALLGADPAGDYDDLTARLTALGLQLDSARATLTEHEDRLVALERVQPPAADVTGSVKYVSVAIVQPPPPPPPGDYTGIATYPGPGNIRFGSNNGSTNRTGEFPGYHHSWWERVVYNSTGSPAQSDHTRGSATVREYFAGPSNLATSLRTGQARAWLARGMVPIFSVKAGGSSLAQIASGAAAAEWDDLYAAANALPAGYPAFYLQFIHEPNAGKKLGGQDPTQQRDYRRASRWIMDRSRAKGTYNTRIVHSKDFLMSPRDFSRVDFRHWDAEIGDDGTTWVTDSAGNRKEYGGVIATDWYDPHVSGDVNPVHAGDINRTFTADMYTNMAAFYLSKGGIPRPVIVGEWGLYTMVNPPGGTFLADLVRTGITVDLIMSDAITIGALHPQFPVWDICFWNSKDGRFDNRNMPQAPAGSADDLLQYAYSDNDVVPSGGGVTGIKLRAFRHIARGDILRTPTGGAVTPATPTANRIWTPNPAGNKVLSTPLS